jgi:ribosomal protein S18 acetylase RimI-like enzyme
MEIRQFNPVTDNIETVADLIISAYGGIEGNISYDSNSRRIVIDLIESGNNFLGKENIYLCVTDNTLSGLAVGYTGKPWSKVRTLFRLLLNLKLFQIANYLIISSQLFDNAYTPNLTEDDFYISVITVDEKYRNRGIGTFMLKEMTAIAKEKNCRKIVLDVDKDNTAALSLYKKFGFIYADIHEKNIQANTGDHGCTMIYRIN